MTRLVLAFLFALTCACGHKIGDSCALNQDCSTDGSRICDIFSPAGGYCTIQNCDFGTCPDEAVCIRFFPAIESSKTCDGPDDCQSDEICAGYQTGATPSAGACALRSIEQRFCMLSCSSDGDCRDGYECRNKATGRLHGGEAVPDPNGTSPEAPDKPFCAGRKSCTQTTDCDPNTERCDTGTHTCVPQ